MGLLSRIETWLGATRADVTVALVLSSIALIGFIHTTFIADGGGPLQEQRALFEMVREHDSLIEAMRDRRLEELRRTLHSPTRAQDQREEAVTTTPAVDTVPDLNGPVLAEAYDRVEGLNDRPLRSAGPREPAGPININTASKEELMDLPGVGEKTAEKIIERRRRRPFRRPEDIMEVKGIGEKKFEKMKKWVVVR